MKKDRYKIFLLLLVIIILIGLALFLIKKQEISLEVEDKVADNMVTLVIDGDTFEIYSGDRVRMICIDAPEINTQEGIEAKEFLEELILGEEVNLEKDFSEEDAYGRKLRYVYLNETFVNKKMVKMGYASVFRYGNDTTKCDEIEHN